MSLLNKTIQYCFVKSNKAHAAVLDLQLYDLPPMGQEAATDMSRAVAAWCRAGHALCFSRLPCELDSVQVAIFLSLGCDGAT